MVREIVEETIINLVERLAPKFKTNFRIERVIFSKKHYCFV